MAKVTLTNASGLNCEVNDGSDAFTINDPSAGGLLTYAVNDDGDYVSAHSGKVVDIDSDGGTLIVTDPGTIPAERRYFGTASDVAKLF